MCTTSTKGSFPLCIFPVEGHSELNDSLMAAIETTQIIYCLIFLHCDVEGITQLNTC